MERVGPPVFAFGPYRLDTAERRLLRGDQDIPLEPKVFDTLLVLVQRAGSLVGKEALMQAVWPDTHVEEGNLTRNVSVLRRVLGSEDGVRIETVPKFGYRFVGQVTRPGPPEAPAIAHAPPASRVHPAGSGARRGPWWILAVLTAVVVGSLAFVERGRGTSGDRRAASGAPVASPADSPPPSADPGELYLKGRHYLHAQTDESLALAVRYFRRAIEIAPDYAPAHGGLAEYYAMIAAAGTTARVPPMEAYPLARASALRALHLDETLPGAHIALGLVAMDYEWDHGAAERALRRAIALAPQHAAARHWYSHYLITRGRFKESLVESRRALGLDPLDVAMNFHLGFHHLYAREYGDAERQLRKTLLLAPSSGDAYGLLGVTLGQQGHHEEAIDALKRGMALGGLDVRSTLVAALALAGRRAESDALLAVLLEEASHRYVSPLELARAHVARREPDAALARLDEAVEERSGGVRELAVDPAFDALRGDPRFTATLARVGLAEVSPAASPTLIKP